MRVGELRIGNKICLYKGEGLTGTVSGIHSDGVIICSDAAGGWSIEDIEGTPLTEEWLKKFGFTVVAAPSAYGYDCNKVSKNYILRGAWNGKNYFALEILNDGHHKKIEFVHQLQNLYFALTGEELSAT